jgi:hypothetical protein
VKYREHSRRAERWKMNRYRVVHGERCACSAYVRLCGVTISGTHASRSGIGFQYLEPGWWLEMERAT